MESVLRDSISETRRIMFLGSCKGIDAARSQAAAKASTLQMVSRGECQGVSTSTQRHLSFGRNSVTMLFPLSIKNFQRSERYNNRIATWSIFGILFFWVPSFWGFAYVGVCVTGRSLLIRGATTEDVEAEKELIELDAVNFLSFSNLSSGNWWFLSGGVFRHGLSCVIISWFLFKLDFDCTPWEVLEFLMKMFFWFGHNANRTW